MNLEAVPTVVPENLPGWRRVLRNGENLFVVVPLALSALHAHFKDVKDLLTSALTLAFFLTPVLYPLSAVGIPVGAGS